VVDGLGDGAGTLAAELVEISPVEAAE
jgi:hypothetical protein